jgi:AmiR/NasT family two-component response regulator
MRDQGIVLRAARPRWRVAILGGTPPARAHLSVAVCSAGGAVALEHESPEEAVRSVEQSRADVVLVTPASVRPGGEVLIRLRDEARCPVVLIARGPSGRLVDLARDGGVMAYLLEPVRVAQIPPTLDLAVERYREIQELRQALADRKIIEKAKGLVMARDSVSEEEAFRYLRRRAMDTRRSLADVSRSVLRAEAAATPA